jgi:hypothetical protein
MEQIGGDLCPDPAAVVDTGAMNPAQPPPPIAIHDEPVSGRSPASRTLLTVVVIVVVGFVVLAGVAALVAAASLGVTSVKQRNVRIQCQRNLSTLGAHWTQWSSGNNAAGSTWAAALQNGTGPFAIPPSILLCPGDPSSGTVTGAGGAPVLSYAIRDFALYPVDPIAIEPQIIACDRLGADGRTLHHKDGLIVLFETGAARWMDRAALGLGPDDPIVVGPTSTHPMLKLVK